MGERSEDELGSCVIAREGGEKEEGKAMRGAVIRHMTREMRTVQYNKCCCIGRCNIEKTSDIN
jgi:hypothetical protein